MALALILLLVLAGVPIVAHLATMKMLISDKTLIHRNDPTDEPLPILSPEIQHFISLHNLKLADSLRFGQIPFVVYRMNEGVELDRMFVVMYARGKQVCEICTDFGPGYSLTTTRSSNAFALPRPAGSFIQGFTKVTLEEILKRHLESELYLLNKNLVVPGAVDQDIPRRLEAELRRQGSHLKAKPYSWLSAPHSFWIKRNMMVNRSVTKILEHG